MNKDSFKDTYIFHYLCSTSLSVESNRTNVDSLMKYAAEFNFKRLQYQFPRQEHDTSPQVLALISFNRFNAINSLISLLDEFNVPIGPSDVEKDPLIAERFRPVTGEIIVNFYDGCEGINLQDPTVEVSMSLSHLNKFFSSYMTGCLLLSRLRSLDGLSNMSEPNLIIPKLIHYKSIVQSSFRYD